jgi:hypothetical protein
MRPLVTLLRNGQPFTADDIGGLEQGAELTYEVATGEILSIVDKDGGEQWKSGRSAQGKIARMVAAKRGPRDAV